MPGFRADVRLPHVGLAPAASRSNPLHRLGERARTTSATVPAAAAPSLASERPAPTADSIRASGARGGAGGRLAGGPPRNPGARQTSSRLRIEARDPSVRRRRQDSRADPAALEHWTHAAAARSSPVRRNAQTACPSGARLRRVPPTAPTPLRPLLVSALADDLIRLSFTTPAAADQDLLWRSAPAAQRRHATSS